LRVDLKVLVHAQCAEHQRDPSCDVFWPDREAVHSYAGPISKSQ
jgi:hypothetical protein